jgi:hypothetical protein
MIISKRKIFSLIILLIGIFSSFMIFFPAMKMKDSDLVFKGYEVAFGTNIANFGSIAGAELKLNILSILGYLLPVTAGLITLIFRRGVILSTILFAASVVLLILFADFTKVTITILSSTTILDVSWIMGYGIYVAIVLSIIGMIMSLLKLVIY